MQGISSIIALILIIIIVVAMVSLFWLFSSSMFSSVTQTGTTVVSHVTETMLYCMNIDSIYQNKIYLRNCGQGSITNDSLNIYIDNAPFSFNMTPSSINQAETATITMPIWGISIGSHTLRIINPNTELLKTIEAVLPDSCVLAYDFDEGSGTNAFDKSRFINTGTLKGDTKWTSGRFGSALIFDGSGDFVCIGSDISILKNLREATLSTWINPSVVDSSERYIIGISINNAGMSTINSRALVSLSSNSKEIRAGGRSADAEGVQYVDTTTDPISVGNWYHVLAIINYAEDTVTVYVNDQPQATSGSIVFSQIATENTVSTNNTIGSEEDASGAFFNGIIDSVRIYNKALTPDETVILKIK
jgi:hypothetical protein